MSLRDRLEEDVKSAMRQRDELVRDTLRMVLSDVKKLEIDRGDLLGDELVLGILSKAAKTRRESLEVFEQAGREDLAARERDEMAVIQRYLPESLGEDETRALVQEAITAVGAASKADLGRVMKQVMASHKGRVDGKTVQRLAAELLG